ESGYMKERLVDSATRRFQEIESGRLKVVGVNCFAETEPSPLTASADGGFLAPDRAAEADQLAGLQAWRAGRDGTKAAASLAELKRAAAEGRNIMEASIASAHAGVTTGEWAGALREIWGEYRAPTGVGRAVAVRGGKDELGRLRERV